MWGTEYLHLCTLLAQIYSEITLKGKPKQSIFTESLQSVNWEKKSGVPTPASLKSHKNGISALEVSKLLRGWNMLGGISTEKSNVLPL